MNEPHTNPQNRTPTRPANGQREPDSMYMAKAMQRTERRGSTTRDIHSSNPHSLLGGGSSRLVAREVRTGLGRDDEVSPNRPPSAPVYCSVSHSQHTHSLASSLAHSPCAAY